MYSRAVSVPFPPEWTYELDDGSAQLKNGKGGQIILRLADFVAEKGGASEDAVIHPMRNEMGREYVLNNLRMYLHMRPIIYPDTAVYLVPYRHKTLSKGVSVESAVTLMVDESTKPGGKAFAVPTVMGHKGNHFFLMSSIVEVTLSKSAVWLGKKRTQGPVDSKEASPMGKNEVDAAFAKAISTEWKPMFELLMTAAETAEWEQ
ncbi:hypothetical protein NBRC116584_17530 [Hydrogenophaga sp. 5NK40-0174]